MEGKRFCFGVSIPMTKALHPDVLLAWGMNGRDLRPEHGFPLRLLVPGYAGVRSPKWLTEVTVQDHPSGNPMQQANYKLLPPDVSADTVDWAKGMTINEMPLNAAICEPAPNACLPAGVTRLRGYATATGPAITRVDVSIDGGRNWRQADLQQDPASLWSWTFWELMVDLPKGEHELTVRAWDSAGQTQPALPEHVWNVKGYLCAAWHRVPVQVG
jgi:sulfite oxidase